jgi:hypothetical protein
VAGHDEKFLLVPGESLLIERHELGLRLRLAKVSRALGQAQNQKGPGWGRTLLGWLGWWSETYLTARPNGVPALTYSTTLSK